MSLRRHRVLCKCEGYLFTCDEGSAYVEARCPRCKRTVIYRQGVLELLARGQRSGAVPVTVSPGAPVLQTGVP